MDKKELERIALGSGKLYIKEYTESIDDVAVLIKELETEASLYGRVSGGASVEYKPKFVTASDDLGLATKTVLTEEEVKFKTGVCTWTGNSLKKLGSTVRVTEDNTAGYRVVKIGGIGNDDGTAYVVLFAHKDKKHGDCYLCVVGKNTGGFSLKFDKEKETIIEIEFDAQSLDDEGTKIIYAEKIAATVV